MENQEKKLTAAEEFVVGVKNLKGFDLHEVIDEKKTVVTVAFGYSKRNHSELIKFTVKGKKQDMMKVDETQSFKEFVSKLKKEE